MNEKSHLSVTVYTPQSPLTQPRQMARDMVSDLRAAHELAWRLAVRDLNAQYRQTLLGFAWVLLVPLGHALIWILLAAGGLLGIGQTAMPYPVFVLAGTMLWAIFAEAVYAPLHTVGSARDVLVRICFPREALVLSGLLQVAFNAMIKVAIVALVLVLFDVLPGSGALWVPLGIAVLILAGTAIGLLLLPFGLLYADVGRILPFAMQGLMYLTPVVYPIPHDGMARTLLLLNPVTAPLEATRQWLTAGSPDLLAAVIMTGAGSLLAMLALWVVYRLAMPIVIERMST